MKNQSIIPSLNFHLWQPCNMRCGFCFATFLDVKQSVLPKGHLSKEKAIELMHCIGHSRLFQKINFAGGEPMLCPWLGVLVKIAKSYGLTTSIISNGSNLTSQWLKEMRPYLDWIGLSIDSIDENTNLVSGRAIVGKKVITKTDYIGLCLKIKSFGYMLKINTVVHQYNWQENFSGFISEIKPERWKVFQVLPIQNQNDGDVERFLISDNKFSSFIERHQFLSCLVPENNEAIKGSYLMIDPAGRFFDNSNGKHCYSQPILQTNIIDALKQINPSFEKFMGRGGFYDWQNNTV